MLFIKAVRQTAPAHITRKNFLLHGRCQPFLVLDALQHTDSGNIGGILLAGGAVSQFRVSNAEIVAQCLGNLRVQRLKGDTLPLGLRLGRDWGGRLLCCLGICHNLTNEGIIVQSVRVNQLAVNDASLFQILSNLFRVNFVKGIFQPCLIPFLCMSNHGIKFQIGEVFIQFLQAVAGNLVDGFFVHLIHQPKSREVCKDFYSVQTVRGGTMRKVYMGKVSIIRILPEYLLTVGINQIFCLILKCPLRWLGFLYWNSFGEFGQRMESMILAENREGSSLICLHCLHTTLPLLIEAIPRQGCIPQGQHHGFRDFPYPLRLRKLPLNICNPIPVVKDAPFGWLGKSIRGILKEVHNQLRKLLDLVISHLLGIAGVQESAHGNHVRNPLCDSRPFQFHMGVGFCQTAVAE